MSGTNEIPFATWLAQAGNQFGTSVATAAFDAVDTMNVDDLSTHEDITALSERITNEVVNDLKPDLLSFAKEMLGGEDDEVVNDYVAELCEEIESATIEWVTATVALHKAELEAFAPHEDLLARAVLGVFTAELTEDDENETAESDDADDIADDDDNFIPATEDDEDEE